MVTMTGNVTTSKAGDNHEAVSGHKVYFLAYSAVCTDCDWVAITDAINDKTHGYGWPGRETVITKGGYKDPFAECCYERREFGKCRCAFSKDSLAALNGQPHICFGEGCCDWTPAGSSERVMSLDELADAYHDYLEDERQAIEREDDARAWLEEDRGYTG